MWQDGYGDELNLREKMRLAEIMAAERDVSRSVRDDVVQEVLITAWQVSEAGHDMKYVHGAMAKRTAGAARDANWTGREGRRGSRDATREVVPLGVNKDGEPLTIEDVAHGEELPESIELAYHQGEIMAALEKLSPRERLWVLGRFWVGMTHAELKARKLDAQYWYRAKAKLEQDLDHLRGLVTKESV